MDTNNSILEYVSDKSKNDSIMLNNLRARLEKSVKSKDAVEALKAVDVILRMEQNHIKMLNARSRNKIQTIEDQFIPSIEYVVSRIEEGKK